VPHSVNTLGVAIDAIREYISRMSDGEIIIERNPKGQFVTGHKQVSPGRPRGSRNKLSENLLSTFASDFEQHGTAVIEQVRRQSPEVYLKLSCDLLPRETAQRMEGASEASVFRSCESVDEIFDVLLDDIGDDPNDVLAFLDVVRGRLLARAADRAVPVDR
jgi:hypothetical protein